MSSLLFLRTLYKTTLHLLIINPEMFNILEMRQLVAMQISQNVGVGPKYLFHPIWSFPIRLKCSNVLEYFFDDEIIRPAGSRLHSQVVVSNHTILVLYYSQWSCSSFPLRGQDSGEELRHQLECRSLLHVGSIFQSVLV